MPMFLYVQNCRLYCDVIEVKEKGLVYRTPHAREVHIFRSKRKEISDTSFEAYSAGGKIPLEINSLKLNLIRIPRENGCFLRLSRKLHSYFSVSSIGLRLLLFFYFWCFGGFGPWYFHGSFFIFISQRDIQIIRRTRASAKFSSRVSSTFCKNKSRLNIFFDWTRYKINS